jgi:SAM-dependent methyltransferase
MPARSPEFRQTRVVFSVRYVIGSRRIIDLERPWGRDMFSRLKKEQFPTRPSFARIADVEKSVLEIGPFNNPTVRGDNVRYFDVMTTEQLKERAERVGYDPATVPEISYVSFDGNLSVVDSKFSAVVSCHCIEHQPDLIRHFKQVEAMLEPKGKYYLVVPDKRYCFDYFLDASSIDTVLAAKGETRHPLAKVIEHRALTTHNDAARHWKGDHLDPGYYEEIPAKTQFALDEFLGANGGYVDVHRWQFTPDSFEGIVSALFKKGEIKLRLTKLHQTPPDDMQFTAVLQLS